MPVQTDGARFGNMGDTVLIHIVLLEDQRMPGGGDRRRYLLMLPRFGQLNIAWNQPDMSLMA